MWQDLVLADVGVLHPAGIRGRWRWCGRAGTGTRVVTGAVLWARHSFAQSNTSGEVPLLADKPPDREPLTARHPFAAYRSSILRRCSRSKSAVAACATSVRKRPIYSWPD